jgi:hypothetical protein
MRKNQFSLKNTFQKASAVTKRALIWSTWIWCASTIFALIEPAFVTPENLDPNAIAPTSLQKEFLRVAAADTKDYLLLGDTDHRKASVSMFSNAPDVLEILKGKGFHTYMIESSPDDAGKITDIANYKKNAQQNAADFHGSWLNREQKKAVDENFINAIQHNKDIAFIPVDTRLEKMGSNSLRIFLLATLPSIPAALGQELIYGGRNESSLLPSLPLIIPIVNQLKSDNKEGTIADDRKTAELILEKSGNDPKTVIFYGRGHFSDDPVSMRQILIKKGYSVSQINLVADRGTALEKIGTADASLVTGADKREEVFAHTPKAERWLETAKHNLRRPT